MADDNRVSQPPVVLWVYMIFFTSVSNPDLYISRNKTKNKKRKAEEGVALSPCPKISVTTYTSISMSFSVSFSLHILSHSFYPPLGVVNVISFFLVVVFVGVVLFLFIRIGLSTHIWRRDRVWHRPDTCVLFFPSLLLLLLLLLCLFILSRKVWGTKIEASESLCLHRINPAPTLKHRSQAAIRLVIFTACACHQHQLHFSQHPLSIQNLHVKISCNGCRWFVLVPWCVPTCPDDPSFSRGEWKNNLVIYWTFDVCGGQWGACWEIGSKTPGLL